MIHKHLNLVRWGSVALLCGKFSPCGTCPGERNKLCFFKSPQKCLKVNTLSPMTSTHSQGKNPTSKPLLPRHQIDSSGPGMSITEIMSPTCTKCGWKVVVHKSAHILYEQYFQHIEFLAYIEFWLLKQVRHCCVRNGSPVFLLCPSTKGRISNDRSFLFSSVLVPVEGWQQWAGIVYRISHRFRLKVSFLCSLSSRLAKGIMMTDLIAAKWLGPSQVENLPLVRNICLVARKQKSQTNVCIVAGISHNCFLSCLPVTHYTKLRAQEPKIKSRVGGSNQ